MTIYCGIDFHPRQHSVCYCDASDGEIHYQVFHHESDDLRGLVLVQIAETAHGGLTMLDLMRRALLSTPAALPSQLSLSMPKCRTAPSYLLPSSIPLIVTAAVPKLLQPSIG